MGNNFLFVCLRDKILTIFFPIATTEYSEQLDVGQIDLAFSWVVLFLQSTGVPISHLKLPKFCTVKNLDQEEAFLSERDALYEKLQSKVKGDVYRVQFAVNDDPEAFYIDFLVADSNFFWPKRGTPGHTALKTLQICGSLALTWYVFQNIEVVASGSVRASGSVSIGDNMRLDGNMSVGGTFRNATKAASQEPTLPQPPFNALNINNPMDAQDSNLDPVLIEETGRHVPEPPESGGNSLGSTVSKLAFLVTTAVVASKCPTELKEFLALYRDINK